MKHFAGPWKDANKDLLKQVLTGELLLLLINILCYGDLFWLLPLQILLYPWILEWNRHKQILLGQKYAQGFQTLLQSLMTSVQAGYTMENACRSALRELEDQGTDSPDPTLIQLRRIVYGMDLGIPLEQLFQNYARETQCEDILQFAVVLDIVKSTGGNMVTILRNTISNFQKKMETEEEIRVILSGMIYEKNMMLCMPLLIMVYMRVTNGEYMSCLYQTLAGHLLVSAVIAGIIGCYYWTESMICLEV